MASLDNRGSAPLGTHLAKHLLRRATYNISKARIDEFAALNVDEALNRLLDYGSNTTIIPDIVDLDVNKPMDYSVDQSFIDNEFFLLDEDGNLVLDEDGNPIPRLGEYQRNSLTVFWYLNEAKNATTLRFKLAMFLHSIFIIDTANDASPRDVYDYILYLFYYSKRSYKELAYKITLNNRMLVYLNTTRSTKGDPNEDFPREFLELFTITRGPQEEGEGGETGVYANYTEHDVKQAARILTGFRRGSRELLDETTAIPKGRVAFYDHDTGDKTFSPKFGSTTILGATDGVDMLRELQDFVDMIFNQEEIAKVICRRMYRFFVRRNIDDEVESDIIEPLATILRDNDYDIGITIRTLLSSKHFYDEDDAVAGDEIIGALVKTPLDLLLHSFNLLEVEIDPKYINNSEEPLSSPYSVTFSFLNQAGMFLFRPDNVAGYKPIYQEPDYDKQWYSFNTIGYRTAITNSIINNKRYGSNAEWLGVTFNIVSFVKNSDIFSDPRNSELLLDEIIELLLVGPLEDFRRAYFYETLLQGSDKENWEAVWDNSISDEEPLKIHLNATFEIIMASAEYQIL